MANDIPMPPTTSKNLRPKRSTVQIALAVKIIPPVNISKSVWPEHRCAFSRVFLTCRVKSVDQHDSVGALEDLLVDLGRVCVQ